MPTLAIALLLVACSTTSKLPEGEILYTGVKRIDVFSADTVDASVQENVALTLEVAPNSSFLGSAYHMSPFPFGLWIYNWLYTTKEKGLRHWLWNSLKSDPTLLSQVNPELRAHAAEIKMEEEGYFDGVVTYDTIFDAKNPRKAKIAYTVRYPHKSTLSQVRFLPTRVAAVDSIIEHTRQESFLKKGDRFNVANLEAEKARIVSVMRDSGYFFYNADAIRYFADSTISSNKISLRVMLNYEADEKQLKPCTIDSVQYSLDWGAGLKKSDHDSLGFMRIDYNQVLGVKPKYLRETIPFDKGALYKPSLVSLATTKISRLNTFKYTQTGFSILNDSTQARRDTTSLLFKVNSTYNYPWQGTLEARAIYKDNNQAGPGINFIAQKRNCFKGGEVFQGELNATYEWMTGNRRIGSSGGIFNSYEFGYKLSLSAPRLQLPRFIRPDFENPVTTRYSLSTDIMRRAGFFNLLKATGELSYTFYTSKSSSHTITPLKLSYSKLMSTSEKFDSVVAENPVLKQSFANQFVPQIVYSYLYDNNSSGNNRSNKQFLQLTVAEAGGILDVLMGEFGTHRKQGDRRLLEQRFSQFIKATIDFRNYYTIKEDVVLASRLYGGIIYAYGNSDVAPYSEQFYIGGANSLRGFSIRGIGPGRYYPGDNRYSYMDQTGDIKLEANLELRFPISGDLKGALFADAGNIWTMRNESSRPDGQLTSKSFLKQVATDVGLGIRYDLSMLVVRMDIGIPIHDPASTKDGYYNPTGSFFGNLGYHLAVGYPF